MEDFLQFSLDVLITLNLGHILLIGPLNSGSIYW